MHTNTNSLKLAEAIARTALEKKAFQVTVIDLRPYSAYTDFMVLASGSSDRHVKAIAEGVEQQLRQEGQRCYGQEGLQEGRWALIDYGHVVLHVFHELSRPLYQLEDLWPKASQKHYDTHEQGSEARQPSLHEPHDPNMLYGSLLHRTAVAP